MTPAQLTRYTTTHAGIYSPGIQVHLIHPYTGGWTCLMPSLPGHPVIADIPTESLHIRQETNAA